ncbi:hypothetical protein BDZ88DRAFT_27326 [Geranomyces variabilis]|nr:hypothetical protein BDZ88DRAFT_27326 [Geranomyces variabilis]
MHTHCVGAGVGPLESDGALLVLGNCKARAPRCPFTVAREKLGARQHRAAPSYGKADLLGGQPTSTVLPCYAFIPLISFYLHIKVVFLSSHLLFSHLLSVDTCQYIAFLVLYVFCAQSA